MSTPKGKRPRKTSPTTSSTRLLREDKTEVRRLAKEFGKPEGEVLRELVHEALRNRRLRKAGRDEITAPVRDAQREIVREELAELRKEIAELATAHGHVFSMVSDLQKTLVPLAFELLFDAWTDSRMSREILLRHLLLPNVPEAQRQAKSYDDFRAEAIASAQTVSRKKVAEYREKVITNPAASRRFVFP